ncbi:MAG: hypothetical protein COA42_19295 [Alteromonadaceae bacterium]|nr:MAG: hypothetical protein COA42_19295 [Alteromonadaceae bacterium]
MQFDVSSLQTETIKEDADYQGVRVRFNGVLGVARVTVQLDIGFDDVLVPGATRADFPTLLELPAPKLLCYSRESAIAEKFEAMVKLGDLNSRMKDFYDIWLLACQFDFDADLLFEAITQTFQHRGTSLPTELPFKGDFVALKQNQWRAFHKRLNAAHVPEALGEICRVLEGFLDVFLHRGAISSARYWQASGTWSQ